MTLRFAYVCLLLLTAACTDSQVVLNDAGDSGRELDDAAAQDAAAMHAGDGWGANNPAECPNYPPRCGAACTGTTFCKWTADCLDTRRPGSTALISARITSQCVDDAWRTETPAVCHVDAGADADGCDE